LFRIIIYFIIIKIIFYGRDFKNIWIKFFIQKLNKDYKKDGDESNKDSFRKVGFRENKGNFNKFFAILNFQF
jgi:hypothetical protein